MADLAAHGNSEFAHKVLHAAYGGYTTCAHRAATPISLSTKRNKQTCLIGEVGLNTTPSQQRYMLESAEVIEPDPEAHTILRYDNGESAAIAYSGMYRAIVMGFPIEVITNDAQCSRLIAKSLDYLLSDKQHDNNKRRQKREKKRR